MGDKEGALQNTGPLDIVIFHVGGIGGYGPVKKVIKLFPKHTVVICFEANASEKDLLVQKKYNDMGVRTLLIPKCVGETHGKLPFYVNKHRASSSIFPPAPQAIGEHILGLGNGIHTWGENCELDYMTEVETVTLDELVKDHTLPSPDILSMDTQGSEMPIMRGGQHSLRDALSVICEVDFIELYDGQDVFPTQQIFLSEHGFRLADILNTQYWHPGPAAGIGFLTVGEALYFRDLPTCHSQFRDRDQKLLLYKLIKLAAVAYAFRRLSYSSKILTFIFENYGSEAESLLVSDEEFGPMLDMHRYMCKNHGNYLKDSKFFCRLSWKENYKEIWEEGKLMVRRKLGILWRYMKCPRLILTKGNK